MVGDDRHLVAADPQRAATQDVPAGAVDDPADAWSPAKGRTGPQTSPDRGGSRSVLKRQCTRTSSGPRPPTTQVAEVGEVTDQVARGSATMRMVAVLRSSGECTTRVSPWARTWLVAGSGGSGAVSVISA